MKFIIEVVATDRFHCVGIICLILILYNVYNLNGVQWSLFYFKFNLSQLVKWCSYHGICTYIYIYIYIGMALFVRGHRWPPNPPVAPQSTGGRLKNRWPLQILAHSFGRILHHLYFTNIWNKLTLTTVYTHSETFMGTSHSLNVYRRKDHSMKNIFHKNGSLF